MAKCLAAFTKEAEEDLKKLDTVVKQRILEKVIWLCENFSQVSHLPLGYEWQGFFKLRVGDWRIVYEIDYSKNEIIAHRIEHRSRVYKKK